MRRIREAVRGSDEQLLGGKIQEKKREELLRVYFGATSTAQRKKVLGRDIHPLSVFIMRNGFYLLVFVLSPNPLSFQWLEYPVWYNRAHHNTHSRDDQDF